MTTSEVLSQVHARVHRRDLVRVSIEHLGLDPAELAADGFRVVVYKINELPIVLAAVERAVPNGKKLL